MAEEPRYLIAKGERLTEEVTISRGGGDKKHPYTLDEARRYVTERAEAVSHALDALPAGACPRDESVAVLTLHPAYLARSHAPNDFIAAAGLKQVGSRPVTITPRKIVESRRRGAPTESAPTETAELIVAGPRARFRDLADRVGTWGDETGTAEDLLKIERFYVDSPRVRIRPLAAGKGAVKLEVALHTGGVGEGDYILDGFRTYLASLKSVADFERRIEVGGLCFLPVTAPRDQLEKVAAFSFLRVARPMPSLRKLRPAGRRSRKQQPFRVALPTDGPLDSKISVAIFDGGLSKSSGLKRWVRLHENGVGAAAEDLIEHGEMVTSAILFGPLRNGQPPARPFAHIDHYRVLDEGAMDDDNIDMFDVLKRITDVLESKRYDFVNLSMGPDLPVEDTEVHVWTSRLDEILSDGQTLMTVAVGNNGENDAASGNARILPPSDCVNALSIGACDTEEDGWARASYSCLGPGRTPGRVKPDALAFGGTQSNPFWVVDHLNAGRAAATDGTSFAAPAALRCAVGIRAIMGSELTPLGLKALLLHRCERTESHDVCEVGWGRLLADPAALVRCSGNEARIVYQGHLTAGRYLRARVPLPAKPLDGKVTITATLCYATPIDPEFPAHYTQSGLEVVFRPHSGKYAKGSSVPKTRSFFSPAAYAGEAERRTDGFKWENVLHASERMFARSLQEPVFDIHFIARERGGKASRPGRIPYALLLTIESNDPSLYDGIVTRYTTLLEPLKPVIELPIRVQT